MHPAHKFKEIRKVSSIKFIFLVKLHTMIK